MLEDQRLVDTFVESRQQIFALQLCLLGMCHITSRPYQKKIALSTGAPFIHYLVTGVESLLSHSKSHRKEAIRQQIVQFRLRLSDAVLLA